jgi:hypothetical protein
MPADKMYERLVEIFRPLALAYSTMTRSRREKSWTSSEE